MAENYADTLREIASLNEHDFKRFMQCLLCERAETCQRGDDCEDENGMCKDGSQIERVVGIMNNEKGQ